MAKVIKAKDWSTTALGSIASWPQSLRTVVSLAQASNSPISLVWGPGHVQIYNDGYWPICGAKHPTSMGQDFRECWASAFPVIGEAYETAWSGKSAYLEKMRMFLDRYGFLEETWFTFSFSPITDESGRVGGLFHPVTEMTSQMLSERRTKTLRDLASRAGKAKTSEEAFALAAQVLAEADLDIPFTLIYVVDASAEHARLVGQTGLAPGTRVAPIDVELRADEGDIWPISDVARGAGQIQIDDVVDRFAGLTVGPYPEVPSMAFALPIMQPGSERPAAVMIAGVSPRLRMNESYRGFFDLVAAAVSSALANARAYEEERTRAEALAELDRAKTTFFSNVSHELRTPLTLILGPIEEALRNPAEPLSGERLELVYRSARRLLRLVNSLLDFSRIEAGRLRVAFEPTDLAALTKDLASSFRSLVERAGLRLTVDCPTLPEPVYVDRSQWENVVLNLLSNAFKFTLEGEIAVSLVWQLDHVELSVRDSGTGISEAELPRIFERFHRVHDARGRSFEGTGIGLALVQELVKLHGGSIRVASKPNEGSVFTVSIPTGAAHLPPERTTAKHDISPAQIGSSFVLEAGQWLSSNDAPEPSTGAASAKAGRILVADDNVDMLDYLVRLLSPHYTVEGVHDGEAALRAARACRPDLVLSDVMMPRLDGFGLLRELRADPTTSMVPVVLLSARAGEEAVVEGLETGADDYLVKPFSARELMTRVRTQLEMARMRSAHAEAAERVRALAMLAFLADSSAVLAESLDYATTLSKVGRLAVPTLADWCFADVIDEDGSIQRVEVAHADPSQAPLAAQLKRFHAARDGNPRNPVNQALIGRHAVLASEIDVERLRAMAQNDEHFELMRATGVCSAIAVPLLARDRVLGVLTFVSANSGRHYGPAELAIAQQLTHRCALAVDNARLYKAAQEAIHVRDEFLSIASHELRTPLTPLQLQLDNLESALTTSGLNNERLSSRLDTASRQTQRLTKLVDNLLDVSRITTGRFELDREDVDLSSLVEGVVERSRVDARAAGCSVDVHADGPVIGRWDTIRLEQIVSNLLSNAFKYGGSKPIEIRVDVSGDVARLIVKDHGIGIAAESVSRIFERFERAVSVRHYGGLGLGLCITRQIVEAHGGRILVESQPGAGSTFTVLLPV